MTLRNIVFLLICSFALAACAPRASISPRASIAPADSPEARQTETVARIAHHRMEIAFLETGSYTTNALVDLDLPRGVRWTVLEFGEASYVVRFTNDAVSSVMWLVQPRGVTVEVVPTD